MSAVKDAAASEMRRFNLSMSFGKGGTYTKSLMCPHKKKLQVARSGELGGHFIKGVRLSGSTNPAVWRMLI
jgi:hypothetical protein